jgi:hypothetical protein
VPQSYFVLPSDISNYERGRGRVPASFALRVGLPTPHPDDRRAVVVRLESLDERLHLLGFSAGADQYGVSGRYHDHVIEPDDCGEQAVTWTSGQANSFLVTLSNRLSRVA